jgi:taurine dioxygenase
VYASGSQKGGKVKILQVAGYIGAEITEVDLSQPTDKSADRRARHSGGSMADSRLTTLKPFGVKVEPSAVQEASAIGALERYLFTYRLVLIEGLPPSDDLLVGIARSLGSPQTAYPARARVRGLPFVKHQVAGPSPNYDATYWHSDRNFGPTPAKATILQCIEAPESGGETTLCDTIATVAALDERIRSVLRGWRGVYEFGDVIERPSERRHGDSAALKRLQDFTEPIVLRHPVTGKECIALEERYVRFDLSDNEIAPGRPILDTILEVIDQGVVYHHHWKAGDILIWDNYATLHKGEPLAEGAAKTTHRIVVM